MDVVLAVAAAAWMVLVAVPFVLVTRRWYRHAQTTTSAPDFKAGLDRLLIGNYWGRLGEVSILGPFQVAPQDRTGERLSVLWAVSLALTLILWAGGLMLFLLVGPLMLPDGDPGGAFEAWIWTLAVLMSLGLTGYVAWRRLGWFHVARFVGGGVLVILLLVAKSR
jgi:hypothetical protein